MRAKSTRRKRFICRDRSDDLAGIIGFTAEPGHGPLPPGELRRIALDISSAPNAIGWKPWTHLEDGLAETVAFLKGI